MKVLKIEGNKAKYLTKESVYKSVKDIGKDDIYNLLNIIYDEDNYEVDENIDSLLDPAEKIIYESLKENFKSFSSNKSALETEFNTILSSARNKYKSE